MARQIGASNSITRCMELSEGIRKIGFRRWYERQLIESHLYLISCFMCLIAVTACLEGFSFRAPGLEPLLRLAAMFASGAVGIWTLGRYLAMLALAQRAAESSVCAKCGTYGRLEVTGGRAASAITNAETALSPLGVRCRKCSHEWTIA